MIFIKSSSTRSAASLYGVWRGRDETVVYDFATQLHRQHQVSNKTFGDATKLLGEQGVMDLIALIGYYDIVSMTFNVAQVQPPASAGPTLTPPTIP